MPEIKNVRIFTSETNIFEGENVGPGLAVIIDPMPTDEKDITLLGDAIRAAVQEVSRR